MREEIGLSWRRRRGLMENEKGEGTAELGGDKVGTEEDGEGGDEEREKGGGLSCIGRREVGAGERGGYLKSG